MVGNKSRAPVTARSGRQPATAAVVLSEGKSSSPSEGPCPGLSPGLHSAGSSLVWCLLRLVVSESPRVLDGECQGLGPGCLAPGSVGGCAVRTGCLRGGQWKERSSDQGVKVPLGDYDPCK